MAERGTSRDYALRRLGQQAPELHAQVLAGALSPNRAMIEAGFTRPRFTVVVTDPAAIADVLRRKLPADMLAAVARELAS